jgi:hypothetical protein
MRKFTIIAAALLVVAIAGAAFAAAYTVLTLPTPGEWGPTGIGVGRLAHVQIEGAVPTNGTFVVSRISADSSRTNALFTRTVIDGCLYEQIGTATNIWIMAGDRLLRSGTVTNACRNRLILEGD